MKYIKEIITGHYHPPFITEESTREEVEKLIGKDNLNLLLKDQTIKTMGGASLYMIQHNNLEKGTISGAGIQY